MTTAYIQRSTASDLSVPGEYDLQLLEDTATEVSQTIQLAGAQTKEGYHYTEPGVPGADGVTGDYTVKVDIAVGDNQVRVSAAVARVNSSGAVQQQTAFSDEQQASGDVQTHSFTNANLGTWTSGDRLRVAVRYRNNHAMNERSTDVAFNTENAEVVTPWGEDEPPPPPPPFDWESTAFPLNSQHLPPVKAPNGAYYAVLVNRSDRNEWGIFKSTDPTDPESWQSVFNRSQGDPVRTAGLAVDGDLLHIGIFSAIYNRFDTSTDSMVVENQAIDGAAALAEHRNSTRIAHRSSDDRSYLGYSALTLSPGDVLEGSFRNSDGSTGHIGFIHVPDEPGQDHNLDMVSTADDVFFVFATNHSSDNRVMIYRAGDPVGTTSGTYTLVDDEVTLTPFVMGTAHQFTRDGDDIIGVAYRKNDRLLYVERNLTQETTSTPVTATSGDVRVDDGGTATDRCIVAALSSADGVPKLLWANTSGDLILSDGGDDWSETTLFTGTVNRVQASYDSGENQLIYLYDDETAGMSFDVLNVEPGAPQGSGIVESTAHVEGGGLAPSVGAATGSGDVTSIGSLEGTGSDGSVEPDLISWHGDGLEPGSFGSGIGDTAHASTQGTAPTVVDSGPRPPRIRWPGEVSSYIVWNFASVDEIAVRWYAEFPTVPAGVRLFALIISGSTSAFNLDMNSSRQLQIHQGGAVRATSVGVVPLNTLVRIEARIQSDGTRHCAAYEGDSTTPIAEATWSGPETTVIALWFGQTFASGSIAERFGDDLRVREQSTLIGPVSESEPEPDKPTGLVATPVSSFRIDLSWDAYDGATGYSIERLRFGPHSPLYHAMATDFGLVGLRPQSWFNDAKAAGYDGFITTLHTFWGCTPNVYGDAATALERALNAGMWIGAYSRPASMWSEALDSISSTLREELQFYALDIEEEPCGFHPPTQEAVDGIRDTYGVRPIIYSGFWIWQNAGMQVSNEDFADVPLWDWFGNYHETDWPEDITESPISPAFGGWNVPGNLRVAWQVRMQPPVEFEGVDVSDEAFTKQFIHAEDDDPIIETNWQSTEYEDTGLSPATEYQYRVGAET